MRLSTPQKRVLDDIKVGHSLVMTTYPPRYFKNGKPQKDWGVTFHLTQKYGEGWYRGVDLRTGNSLVERELVELQYTDQHLAIPEADNA